MLHQKPIESTYLTQPFEFHFIWLLNDVPEPNEKKEREISIFIHITTDFNL